MPFIIRYKPWALTWIAAPSFWLDRLRPPYYSDEGWTIFQAESKKVPHSGRRAERMQVRVATWR